jgi:hypothetical protein
MNTQDELRVAFDEYQNGTFVKKAQRRGPGGSRLDTGRFFRYILFDDGRKRRKEGMNEEITTYHCCSAFVDGLGYFVWREERGDVSGPSRRG